MNSGYSFILIKLAFVIGIAPYSVQSDGKFYISRYGNMSCLFNLIFAIFVNAKSIQTSATNVVDTYNSPGVNVSELYPIVVFMVASVLSMVMGVLNAILKRNLTMDILNDVTQLHQFVHKLNGTKVPNSKYKLFYSSILMCISVTFYVGYDIVQHFQYNGPLTGLLEYIGIDWCSLIPLCVEALFAMLCMHICDCFDAISESSSRDLKLLYAIFVKLCLLIEKINVRFGLDFLISISSARIILISSLFVLVSSFLNFGTFKELNNIYLISYALSALIRAFYVCYYCRKVSLKAEATKEVLLHLCTTPLHRAVPSSMGNIMSNKRTVTFDACGYIQINMDLLAELVGSVITYLVVLIQFQIMKK